jgi:hypothetical protein
VPWYIGASTLSRNDWTVKRAVSQLLSSSFAERFDRRVSADNTLKEIYQFTRRFKPLGIWIRKAGYRS